MFKEIGQIASMIKKAQGMKGRIAEVKEKMARFECVGEAGGGMVQVTIGGTMKILDCKVAQQLVDSRDKAMLEQLMAAAINDAITKLMAVQAQEMGAIAGEMDIDGLGNALSGLGLGNQ